LTDPELEEIASARLMSLQIGREVAAGLGGKNGIRGRDVVLTDEAGLLLATATANARLVEAHRAVRTK